MGVHWWKSRIACRILSLCTLSAQETGLCQFRTECDAPAIHGNCHFVFRERGVLFRKFPDCVPKVPSAVTALPRSYYDPEFHLGTVKHLRYAVRKNEEEIAFFCVAGDNRAPVLPYYVQPMLAEHHDPQEDQTKICPHTALFEFFLFPALRTPLELKLLTMRNDPN